MKLYNVKILITVRKVCVNILAALSTMLLQETILRVCPAENIVLICWVFFKHFVIGNSWLCYLKGRDFVDINFVVSHAPQFAPNWCTGNPAFLKLLLIDTWNPNIFKCPMYVVDFWEREFRWIVINSIHQMVSKTHMNVQIVLVFADHA
jgi:hypothetical protein